MGLHGTINRSDHPPLPTLLWIANVELNSKCRKSLGLVQRIQLTHTVSDRTDFTKNREVAIISKTSRHLFSRKSLICEIQLSVEFYSNSGFSRSYRICSDREGKTRRSKPTTHFLQALISSLTDKTGPSSIGPLRTA